MSRVSFKIILKTCFFDIVNQCNKQCPTKTSSHFANANLCGRAKIKDGLSAVSVLHEILSVLST